MGTEANVKNIQKRAIFIAFLFYFLQQGKIFIQASLSKIAQAFPDQSITSIQTLISGTAIPLLIGAVLAGIITVKVMTKKQLSIIAMILILVGGMGPLAFSDNFSMIMVARLVLGFGLGLLSPLKSAIVGEYASGVTRNRIMGLGESTVTVAGILINLVGGYLAMISWKASFYLYLSVVPVFILALILLPNKKPAEMDKLLESGKEKVTKVETSEASTGFKLNAKLIAVFAFGFLFMLFFNIYGLNLAMYIVNQGIGQPMQAGVAGSALSVGGIIAGVALGFVYKKFRHATLGIGCIAIGIGFGIMAFNNTLTMAIVGSMIAGFGLNTCVAQGTFLCTVSSSEKYYALTAGIYVASIHIAQFLTPYVLNPIAVNIAENGSMNRFAAIFMVSSIATTVIGVAYIFIINAVFKEKSAETVLQKNVTEA
ncbi:MAG: MFS transporter [Youngiibacter sp.]|nr:MFS transporter [Youngiibacter sp.]